MKMPKRLIASLGVLMLSATPLLHASADEHDDHDYDHRGPQYEHRGDDHRDHRPENGRPPHDFGPVREAIRVNHGDFGRGAPPPPGVRWVRGQPLPHGYYGERLDSRALSRLPYYPGYEWRRMGGDVVLIALGSGVVYEVLEGVLY